MSRIKIEYPASETVFTTIVPVLINHINYGNHLGYDAMLSILQEARIRFLKQYHMTESCIDGDVGYFVTDIAVNYLAEAFHGDELAVALAVDEFGKRSCEFFYQITHVRSGKKAAVGKTGVHFYNQALKKTVAVPENFKHIVDQAKLVLQLREDK